jgi:tRNA wybutosine-synthesizing protein 1
VTQERQPYPDDLYRLLKKQGYHWVGRHSATKKCKWLHESLVRNRPCYKEQFYGIQSHRCLQMSPAVLNCLTYCLHCWRAMPEDIGLSWDRVLHGGWDEPEKIAIGLLQEHRRILSGYKAQVLSGIVDEKRYREALHPNQIAMSLSGEPTLFSHLGGLIRSFLEKGCTVFLVTSGVLPKALKTLNEEGNEPTRLYVSLTAPDKETYLRLNRPISEDLWSALMRSLDLLGKFRCTTVLRLTVLKGVNMGSEDINRFAELLVRSGCREVEVKGYMHIGFSTTRLSEQNMPLFSEVKGFSEKLCDASGYRLKAEAPESRVVLLTK